MWFLAYPLVAAVSYIVGDYVSDKTNQPVVNITTNETSLGTSQTQKYLLLGGVALGVLYLMKKKR